MIHVIATIQVHPQQRSAFLQQFAWVVPLVRAEDGCLEYEAAVDLPTSIRVQTPPREDVVVVVEKWTSLAALEAHLKAAHMAEYRDRVKDYVIQVTLQVLQPV